MEKWIKINYTTQGRHRSNCILITFLYYTCVERDSKVIAVFYDNNLCLSLSRSHLLD